MRICCPTNFFFFKLSKSKTTIRAIELSQNTLIKWYTKNLEIGNRRDKTINFSINCHTFNLRATTMCLILSHTFDVDGKTINFIVDRQ